MLRRVLLLALLALVALPAAGASAHNMPTSAVLMDVRSDDVAVELRLPIDRLEIALQRPLSPAQAAQQGPQLERYVSEHVRVAGTDGTPWRVEVGRSHVERAAISDLVVPLRFVPPGGDVGDFELTYDAIIHQLASHRAIAAVRTDFDRGVVSQEDAQPVGIFDFSTKTLTVRASGGSWLRGMVSAVTLGVEHVSSGADHLLFLLMLLLPAPLVAVGHRWRRGPSAKRSAVRVVHVTGAFALGHSTTLLLAGLGVIHVPSRPIETLIAFSIAVSAVHAIRPIVRRGEVFIAAGFGLVHGLAFASAISNLGLARGSLVATLFGFNIGIELTQLFVVALIMPSLVVLSRTTVFSAFRLLAGAVGVVFATSWMLERTTLTDVDPFEPAQTWAVDNPFVVAAAIAVFALLASTRPHKDPTCAAPEPSLS